MKVTIEVEVDNLTMITKEILGEQSRPMWVCYGRLPLLRSIHDLVKECVKNGQNATLTQTKNILDKHLTQV